MSEEDLLAGGTPTPSVSLEALTPEATHALGGVSSRSFSQFPIRAGRERRVPAARRRSFDERRFGDAPQLNDVYLSELPHAGSLHISGAHFDIELIERRFFLVDRGSAGGTIVAGRRIGGHRTGGRTELRDGDDIVVGTNRSRYVFRFRVSTDSTE